jgi:hypothetical protein
MASRGTRRGVSFWYSCVACVRIGSDGRLTATQLEASNG